LQDALRRGVVERVAIGHRVPARLLAAGRRAQAGPAGPGPPAAYECSRQRLRSNGV
jgi:hypothetical protein